MRLFRILGALIAIGLLVGLGGAIFQTGFLAGAAANGTTVTVPVGYGWGYGFHPFGFFGFLGSLLVFFLVIGLIRAAIFGGRHHGAEGWGHGSGRGPWGGMNGHGSRDHWMDRAREVHDEWHRRDSADRSAPPDETPAPPASGGTA